MSLNDTTDSESRARMAIWRKVIGYLESDPETFAAVVAMAELHEPPDAITFEGDNLKYQAIRAIADDYLKFGHYAHCASCMVPVAAYPDRKLDYPAMTLHECGGVAGWRQWDRRNTAARHRDRLLAKGTSAPAARR